MWPGPAQWWDLSNSGTSKCPKAPAETLFFSQAQLARLSGRRGEGRIVAHELQLPKAVRRKRDTRAHWPNSGVKFKSFFKPLLSVETLSSSSSAGWPAMKGSDELSGLRSQTGWVLGPSPSLRSWAGARGKSLMPSVSSSLRGGWGSKLSHRAGARIRRGSAQKRVWSALSV